MRNFTYNRVQEITICTALPNPRNSEVDSPKSVAVYEQTTSDLGFLAAQNIMQSKSIDPNDIGAIIFLTKTPDYRGPATAMVLQNRLQIPQDCIVYDSPTGNGGFESAINLGSTLLSTIHKKYALVVCGDTISKQLSDADMKQLDFQDGATAIFLQKGEAAVVPVSMSTMALSKDWSSFMVPSGGFRENENFFKNIELKRASQTVEHLHINFSKITMALKPELTTIKNKVIELIDEKYASNFVILINLLVPELENKLALLFSSEVYSHSIYLSSNYSPQTMASTIPLMLERIASESKQTPFQVVSVSLGEGLSVSIGSMVVRESTVLESVYSDMYYDNGFVTHDM